MTYELYCCFSGYEPFSLWFVFICGLLTVSRGLFSYELSAMNISFACGLLLASSCLRPTAGPDSKLKALKRIAPNTLMNYLRASPFPQKTLVFMDLVFFSASW
jgi:hypothetical protein